MTPILGDDVCLPVQLDKHLASCSNSDCTDIQTPPTWQSERLDGFGRQAQAICLLDRVLSTIRATGDLDDRLMALESLDRELQDFLAVTMGEYQGPGHHCGANATALR